MKKFYLVFLLLVLLFIPTTNAVAVYQLDQPVSRLNGYTLREVFENRNMSMPDLVGKPEISPNIYRLFQIGVLTLDYNIINGNYISNTIGGQFFESLSFNVEIGKEYTLSSIYVSGSTNQPYRVTFDGARTPFNITENQSITFTPTTITNIVVGFASSIVSENYTFKLKLEKGSTATPYQVPTNGPYSDIDVGLFGLTNEEIQTYYDLYLEAVRFEYENIEASRDPDGYQNIFKSVINGVKGLIVEMGNVWQFLNAPIITSDMSDYSFSIDWSWDLIGVVRQLINSLAILILQTNFIFINLLFSFTGIPVQISILSMIFSNFVFVILGWIIVKSFII